MAAGGINNANGADSGVPGSGGGGGAGRAGGAAFGGSGGGGGLGAGAAWAGLGALSGSLGVTTVFSWRVKVNCCAHDPTNFGSRSPGTSWVAASAGSAASMFRLGDSTLEGSGGDGLRLGGCARTPLFIRVFALFARGGGSVFSGSGRFDGGCCFGVCLGVVLTG